jgi:hypothetical protein
MCPPRKLGSWVQQEYKFLAESACVAVCPEKEKIEGGSRARGERPRTRPKHNSFLNPGKSSRAAREINHLRAPH